MPYASSSAAGDVSVAGTGLRIIGAMQPSAARGETSGPRPFHKRARGLSWLCFNRIVCSQAASTTGARLPRSWRSGHLAVHEPSAVEARPKRYDELARVGLAPVARRLLLAWESRRLVVRLKLSAQLVQSGHVISDGPR